MKKLFTLLLTVGSFTAVFAQGSRNNDRNNNGYGQHNNDVVMNNDHGRNYGNAPVYNYPSPSSRGTNDRDRQQDWDHKNNDYDRRGNDYGYGSPAPVYDRDRRVYEQRDRKDNNGSFATGAVVGGIAGVLLGVLISHH